jgi:hypothetical protein
MNQTKSIITAYLAERGITSFTMYEANGCIGVSYGRISCYMYIKDGMVVEVIYD